MPKSKKSSKSSTTTTEHEHSPNHSIPKLLQKQRSKKNIFETRFPAPKVKTIMQTDDEVGKIAATAPVVMAKAVECFLEDILEQSSRIACTENTTSNQIESQLSVESTNSQSNINTNSKSNNKNNYTTVNLEHLQKVLSSKYQNLFPSTMQNLNQQIKKQKEIHSQKSSDKKDGNQIRIKKRKKSKNYEDSD